MPNSEKSPGTATASSGSISVITPPAPVINKRPTNFLELPRELRDEVYTYLLSTEYTKHDTEQGTFPDFVRRSIQHHFHTSILYTNRQINSEATETFYNDNLFVYVYCSEFLRRALYKIDVWYRVVERAPKIKHHAMKMEVLDKGEDHETEKSAFIISSNELPAFCEEMVVKYRSILGFLDSVKLRLVIRDKIGNDGVKPEEDEEEQGEEEEEVIGHTSIESRLAKRNASTEGGLTGIDEKMGTTSSRVRRLLEPFRKLNGIRDSQIIGPVPYGYRVQIIREIGKLPPSDQDIFDHVLTAYKEAMNIFDSEDFVSSKSALIETLGIISQASRGYRHEKIATGLFAGCTFWKVYQIVEFEVWTKLVWTCVKTRDFITAQFWRDRLVPHFIGSGEEQWVTVSPRDHDIGMVFYLDSQLTEDRDCIDHQNPVRASLQVAIKALKKGLQHEPRSRLLKEELKRKELELELVEETEMESLMSLADRLDPESIEINENHWNVPGWLWNHRG